MLAALNAPGALLLFEPFNYSNGSLVNVGSGQWSTHSGIPGQIEVISGRLELRVPETEDVNVLLPGQPYPATTEAVLYVSFTLNFSSLPSASGQYFLHCKGTGTSNFRAKVFGLTSGAADGKYRLGVANAGNAASATIAQDLNLHTDYRIYLRYAVNSGSATLWVDPDAESSASVVGADSATAATLTSLALRQDSGIGAIAFDDLRVGTSFADVYAAPAVIPPSITQEPANVAALEVGSASFITAAVGTAPLTYQWAFNGNVIPDATNAVLTLHSLTTNDAGAYRVVVSNAAGTTTSKPAMLTVIQPNVNGTLSLVHYNVKGNFTTDWSTNAVQVQAIARQLQYLNPDIITLNEIPNGQRHEMTNWLTAFFPTYTLAISPGTDGVLRSGVLSRFPFVRSNAWLVNASLTNFGYHGTYTRDLFETEIAVPGATESVHVFTTHLKSGADADSQQRRAAECSAVSNFFATVFLATNRTRPYLLTGDLNEDINLPMSQNLQAIQRLTNETGLQLTTPVNPFTLSRITHSIQGNLDARFDYVLPAGVLSANVIVAQVFRTDLLPTLPPPLLASDSASASDHLPVQLIFNYPDPPLRTTLQLTGQNLTLTWPALVGRRFNIESSPDLAAWSVTVSNIVATSNHFAWITSPTHSSRFYRVIRVP